MITLHEEPSVNEHYIEKTEFIEDATAAFKTRESRSEKLDLNDINVHNGENTHESNNK